jgi:hypothetical protein
MAQKEVELSEIIMEINDLQNTSLDNQPLAQTMLEINDLRWMTTPLPPPRPWRTGSRENAQKSQKAGLGLASGSVRSSIATGH